MNVIKVWVLPNAKSAPTKRGLKALRSHRSFDDDSGKHVKVYRLKSASKQNSSKNRLLPRRSKNQFSKSLLVYGAEALTLTTSDEEFSGEYINSTSKNKGKWPGCLLHLVGIGDNSPNLKDFTQHPTVEVDEQEYLHTFER